MIPTLRLAFLLSLVPALSFAESWSGALVDSNCYTAAVQNSSHGHPGSGDTKRAVRSCSPTDNTTSFSFVQQVGTTFTLDAAGNAKARELFLKAGKNSPFRVHVTGDITADTLRVDKISHTK